MADQLEGILAKLNLTAENASWLCELPVRVLWKILRDAVVSSATTSTEVDYDDVLTSLSRVCKRFRDVVRDPEFRSELLEELAATDPTQRLRRSSSCVQLTNIRVSSDRQFDLLGDELFVVVEQSNGADINVYGLDSLQQWQLPSAADWSMSAGKESGESGAEHEGFGSAFSDVRLPQKRVIVAPVAPPFSRIKNLQACDFNRCLYLSATPDQPQDSITTDTAAEVYRISPEDGRVLAQWKLDNKSAVDDGLAVCHATGNVVISNRNDGHIIEFNSDGRLVRVIDVKELVAASYRSLDDRYSFEAVPTSTSTYLITHLLVPDPLWAGNLSELESVATHICLRKTTGNTELTPHVLGVRGGDPERRRCGVRLDSANRCIVDFHDKFPSGNIDGQQSTVPDDQLSHCIMGILGPDLTTRRLVHLVCPATSFVRGGFCQRLDPQTGRLFVCIDERKDQGDVGGCRSAGNSCMMFFDLLRDDFK